MGSGTIVEPGELVLITGAGGFIGRRLVEVLLEYGCRNLRCLVRAKSSRVDAIRHAAGRFPEARVEVVQGNLTSAADARSAAHGASLAFHLAAGIDKSFAGSFLNTVVGTRNLLEGVRQAGVLKRFINVSSLAVYSNRHLARHAPLDETCAIESEPIARGEAYVYAKLKQEEIVREYSRAFAVPYVVVRPGAVYGPGKHDITSRVGIDTFGLFLHLGGRNRIPFTHVRNCAEAIVLAGLTPGIDGEAFNVVDDDVPTSREFMAEYRKSVDRRPYLSVPYPVFAGFCYLWARYSRWSQGQLPPTFNPYKCSAYWKGNRYPNRKLKELVGWRPVVSYRTGAPGYYEYLRGAGGSSC